MLSLDSRSRIGVALVPGKRTALIAARVEKGLTVEDLASAVGVSRWCLYKVEEGKRNPSYGLMSAIAKELGKPVDALFFATDLDSTASQEVSAS